MVKAYLRYEHAGAFGVISSGCNVLYDSSGKQLFTGALENITAWNIRQGSQVRQRASNGRLGMYIKAIISTCITMTCQAAASVASLSWTGCSRSQQQ